MPGLPRLVLGLGGVVLLVTGLVGIALGATSGPFLRSLLPPVVVDAAAVGGATVALSGLLLLIGAAQLALAAWAGAQRRWTTASAVIVSGLLASAFLAGAVVSVTEAARSGSVVMLGLGACALVVALAYAAASLALARSSV